MSVVRKETARTTKWLACFAVAALLGMSRLAMAGEPYFTLKTTVTLSGNALNSFDISWVDPDLHAYLLSDRSNKAVDVIDTVSKAQNKLAAGAFAGVVSSEPAYSCPPNACDGPNGVVSFYNPASGKHEVWAGDGPTPRCTGRQKPPYTTACSTVKVIDFETGTLLHNIPTGGQYRADELCYDPVDHVIQIANDSDNPPYVNFIPTEGPNAYTVVKKVVFDGKRGDGPNATHGIEACQWNPRNGLIYLNLPEVNGNGNDITDGYIVLFDPRSMQLVGEFDIPVKLCAGPQGMAVGPVPEIMLGCNAMGPPDSGLGASETGTGAQNTVMIDERNGNIIKTLANQGGNDEVWFNPGNGLYFLAEGQNVTQAQLGIISSLPAINLVQEVAVARPSVGWAHSVAADASSGEVYFPIPNDVGGTGNNVPNPCGANASQGCIAIYSAQW